MARQYVAIEFRRGGRTYTYHHDGEAIVPGDEVKVPDRSGDGWSRVRVVEVDWIKPGYETKPILGRIEAEGTEKAIVNAPDRNDPKPTLDLFGGRS